MFNTFFAVLKLKRILRKQSNSKVIAFSLPDIGYLQFFQDVLLRYAVKFPLTTILIVHQEDAEQIFNKLLPDLSTRVIPVNYNILGSWIFPEINVFFTNNWGSGLDGVYSVELFHGQPSKGLSFSKFGLDSHDALFLYGAMQKAALGIFLQEWGLAYPKHLDIFEIGYPKSDKLLNDGFDRKQILNTLELNEKKATILYAPAFNEGASLREYGIKIIQTLSQLGQYNVLVKLPIDCWAPTGNFYATGGVDWFASISVLENKFPNLRLIRDYQIDPLLACSDVLITCISSVSFEFLALNKPVIFIDTPKFYEGYLKERFPGMDTVSWANRTTVNGGKEFGPVVNEISQLPVMIETVFANPDKYPFQKEKLRDYLLYNRGCATEAAVEKISQLISENRKSSRPWISRRICGYLKRFARFLLGPSLPLFRKIKAAI